LVLRGHRLLVSGLSFSADGTRLASASPDGVVRVWALDLDDLIAIARQEVTRELIDDECRQYLHLPDGCA
jgi:WD40 repeat protein